MTSLAFNAGLLNIRPEGQIEPLKDFNMVLPDGFGKCERGHNRVWILTIFLTGLKVFPTDKGPKKASMWKV